MPGFRLGNHEFLEPGGPPAPLSRLTQQPRFPIADAPPPKFAAPFCAPADPNGPAALLASGEFCGHGEPTFTVFDLALDGQRQLELAVPYEQDAAPTLQARPAGSRAPWRTLLNLAEIFDYCRGQQCSAAPQSIADEEGHILPVRAAIGFEYPCEATSAEDVSWIAVAVEYGDEREKMIMFSEETA